MTPVPRMPMAPPQVEIEFRWNGQAATTTVHRSSGDWHANGFRLADGGRVSLAVDVGAGESVARVRVMKVTGTPSELVLDPQAVALTAVRPRAGGVCPKCAHRGHAFRQVDDSAREL